MNTRKNITALFLSVLFSSVAFANEARIEGNLDYGFQGKWRRLDVHTLVSSGDESADKEFISTAFPNKLKIVQFGEIEVKINGFKYRPLRSNIDSYARWQRWLGLARIQYEVDCGFDQDSGSFYTEYTVTGAARGADKNTLQSKVTTTYTRTWQKKLNTFYVPMLSVLVEYESPEGKKSSFVGRYQLKNYTTTDLLNIDGKEPIIRPTPSG